MKPRRFAYADPPYLGMGRKLYGKHHPEAALWDDPETHRQLVARLTDEYPDGWAISLNPKDLPVYLPACPKGARVGVWVKPGLPNVPIHWSRIAFCWEPLIFFSTIRLRRSPDDLVVPGRDPGTAQPRIGARQDIGPVAHRLEAGRVQPLGSRLARVRARSRRARGRVPWDGRHVWCAGRCPVQLRGGDRMTRHAQDPYWEFYDAAAQETAAWLNGSEWARDPEQREAEQHPGYCFRYEPCGNCHRCTPPADSTLACECGDKWPCPHCNVCMSCGPESVRCDVDGRHCELCVDACLPCQRARRAS